MKYTSLICDWDIFASVWIFEKETFFMGHTQSTEFIAREKANRKIGIWKLKQLK